MIQASTNTVHIYWYTSLRKAPSPSHHPRAYGLARNVPTPTTTSAPQRILRDVGIRRHPSSVHSSFPVRRARARHLSCLAAPAALGWYTSTVTSNPSMHGSRCSASYGLEAPPRTSLTSRSHFTYAARSCFGCCGRLGHLFGLEASSDRTSQPFLLASYSHASCMRSRR